LTGLSVDEVEAVVPLMVAREAASEVAAMERRERLEREAADGANA
jgi:hypothetical protein